MHQKPHLKMKALLKKLEKHAYDQIFLLEEFVNHQEFFMIL